MLICLAPLTLSQELLAHGLVPNSSLLPPTSHAVAHGIIIQASGYVFVVICVALILVITAFIAGTLQP